MSVEAIGDAKVMIVGKSNEVEVRKTNMSLWSDLINQNPSFTLLVCYEVCVRTDRHEKNVDKVEENGAQKQEKVSSENATNN